MSMKNIVQAIGLFVLLFAMQIMYAENPRAIKLETPKRSAGQTDVLKLACDPIPTVRVAFIGLGNRGSGAVYRFMSLEGVEVKALCDVVPEKVERAQNTLKKNNHQPADTYTNKNDWKKVCERDDIDLVYICTPWLAHTPMAVYAMKQGKHVAVEVPAAMSISECWDLVNTAEQTRRHCMMLENCCYDFFEMATLNMAQQGKFGDIVHGEGAYIHDLRSSNFDKDAYYNMWRLDYNAKHTGNLYPTHGLGPICQIMNIHRGDKMNYLVSVSSDQKGMTQYAENKFGKDSKQAKGNYARGDMNTTIIRTEKGKTIMVQHDVTSPRPYSRLHTVSGTKGYCQKYPMEGLAFDPNAHGFLNDEQRKQVLAEYEHPITKEVGEKARKVGGHGGMDFIMDYRLIYCLRNGLPLDQDVYDAAEWSCLTELTELSVKNGSIPVEIPDFTRGAWNKLQGLTFAE